MADVDVSAASHTVSLTTSSASQEKTHAGYHYRSHRHREQSIEYVRSQFRTGLTTPSLTVRGSKDEIIEKLVKRYREWHRYRHGEDAQVTQAYDLGVVETAAEVAAAAEAAAAAMAASSSSE